METQILKLEKLLWKVKCQLRNSNYEEHDRYGYIEENKYHDHNWDEPIFTTEASKADVAKSEDQSKHIDWSHEDIEHCYARKANY